MHMKRREFCIGSGSCEKGNFWAIGPAEKGQNPRV